MKIRAAIPARARSTACPRWGLSRLTAADEVYKTLPYVNFDDVGGGIGGTANYNTFIYASENSDVSRDPHQGAWASTNSAPALNT